MPSNPPISEEDPRKALVEMAAALAQFHAKYAVIDGMAAPLDSPARLSVFESNDSWQISLHFGRIEPSSVA
jgi:hypothetical protein